MSEALVLSLFPRPAPASPGAAPFAASISVSKSRRSNSVRRSTVGNLTGLSTPPAIIWSSFLTESPRCQAAARRLINRASSYRGIVFPMMRIVEYGEARSLNGTAGVRRPFSRARKGTSGNPAGRRPSS